MKDQIAQEIANELRLIREELLNLTMAVRSSNSSNSKNLYAGKHPKSYQPGAPHQPDPGRSGGQKAHRTPRLGEPRRQWHQNVPKDEQ